MVLNKFCFGHDEFSTIFCNFMESVMFQVSVGKLSVEGPYSKCFRCSMPHTLYDNYSALPLLGESSHNNEQVRLYSSKTKSAKQAVSLGPCSLNDAWRCESGYVHPEKINFKRETRFLWEVVKEEMMENTGRVLSDM